MNGTKFFVCIIWLVTLSKLLIRAEETLNNCQISFNKTQNLKIFPGIKFFLKDSEISIHVRIHDLLRETEMQTARNKEKKKNPLQKLGFMMMMTPFIMQILSLPGAIANVKLSLLRSIMVAQLAIAIMIYNLIKSSQDSEIVVVHKPYHHIHYRHGFPDDIEDEWFDAEGLITGEYGFITADGVYHETGYKTDKNGDFIITKQRNRKITSLKDAQEIFKDRPEAAKKLIEAIMKACSGCKIPIKQENDRPKPVKTITESPLQKKMEPILKRMMKILTTNTSKSFSEEKNKFIKKEDITKSMVRAAKKLLSEEDKLTVNDRVLEKMADDLYYQFNYTITSHGHHEDGYRSGRKNGSYRSPNKNGIDTQVRYLSNEFGHQPNITFVPQAYLADEKHGLKGYSFRWYWS
ncbi:MBN protein, partial [Acromyrmex charruanus]